MPALVENQQWSVSANKVCWTRYVVYEWFGHAGLPRYPKYLATLGVSTVVLLLCVSCSTIPKTPPDERDGVVVLLDPEIELREDWENRRLRRGHTKYERVSTILGDTIRATGDRSASILYRLFEPIDLVCNEMRWSWYVRKPQPGSDLHTKGKDDVAASIFVLFGDPGLFLDRPVPALKYVWANDRHRAGEIIVGPYHKQYVRTIIVRSGNSADAELEAEQTNLIEDYMNAFGESPKNGIHGIAIFTDNDDTNEPIVSHYGRIELFCNSE